MILLKNQKRVLDALEICGLSEYEALEQIHEEQMQIQHSQMCNCPECN